MERLDCSLREIKLAPSDSEDAMSFEGYGAVFGNVDSYGDVIAPGAFAQFLADVKDGKQNWPAMLAQHGGMGMSADDMTPVGVWTELSEDGTGLKVKGKFADTPRGRELYSLAKMTPRPAIDGLSIGYIPVEFKRREKPEDPRRTLTKIKVMEISPVTFPANGLARVSGVKSIEDIDGLKTGEKYLREEKGFSKTEAVAFMSRIKSVCLSDSEDAGGRSDSEAEELLALIKQRSKVS